jgi:hypothetical protein
MFFGTANEPHQAPGIDSNLSRARQTGLLASSLAGLTRQDDLIARPLNPKNRFRFPRCFSPPHAP